MTQSPLGAMLMQAREAAGLTPTELAVAAALPLSRLLQLESGWMRPYEGELRALGAHLGLAPEAIAGMLGETCDR